MRSLRTALSAVMLVLVAVFAGTAMAQNQQSSSSEQWEVLLKQQLKQSYNCDLANILYVREVPVGNLTSTEGRVRCIDEREFEFSRARPHERFTIHLCQPAVC